MRLTKILPVGTLLLLLGAGVIEAEEEVDTFDGSYDWRQGGSDRLSVDFKPDGENRWKVTFRFRFNGRDETWRGRAEGSLTDGSTLIGTATSGSRDWVFKAEIEDGVMKGTHREVKRGGREHTTGTFDVSR